MDGGAGKGGASFQNAVRCGGREARFIADAMLGRLARWLRLTGFDVLYIPDIPDGLLLKIAKEEGRLILTRDTRLRKRGIDGCLLIESDDVFEQLSQVIKALDLEIPDTLRCAACNGMLFPVEKKEDIEGSVPEHVYLSRSRFLKCAGCGRVYWEGTQYADFRERLKGVMRDAG